MDSASGLQLICAVCGAPHAPRQRFCRNCGTPVAQAPVEAPSPPPAPVAGAHTRRGPRVVLLGVAGALAAAVAGGGAYTLTSDGDGDARPSDSIGDRAQPVVRETVTTVTTVTTAAPPIAGAFVAQLGSFRGRPGAEAEAARLRTAGVDARVLRSDDYKEFLSGFWVVYAGPFERRAEARTAARSSGVKGAFGRPVTAVP